MKLPGKEPKCSYMVKEAVKFHLTDRKNKLNRMKRACKHFTSKVMIMLACELHTTFEKTIITV